MAIEQYYFTSWYNSRIQSSGFQTKAKSSGVMPAQEEDAARFGSYQIPPGVDVGDLAHHPIALRYRRKDAHQAMLLCSQSNGRDDSVAGGLGREGNFFLHALFFDPEEVAIVPPIAFWRSPFWVKRDTTTNEVLPALEGLHSIPHALDLEDIWTFLAQGERRVWFYKLLSAVITSETKARPIVIADTPDNIARWITALSCALPSWHRPLLNFTTYAPTINSNFMITGVQPATAIRYPEEYLTYFVLHAEAQRISDVGDSYYARVAAEAMTANRYDDTMLTLFNVAMHRFPRPNHIDPQLDLIAQYSVAVDPQRRDPLSPNEQASLRGALDGFAQLTQFDEDDLYELEILHRTYLRGLHQRWFGGEVPEYARLLPILMQRDPEARAHLAPDLQTALTLLMAGETATATFMLTQLTRALGAPVLQNQINQRAFLGPIAEAARSSTTERLLALWQAIGGYLQPTPDALLLLLPILRAAYPFNNGQWQATEAAGNLRQLVMAQLAQQKVLWLQLLTTQFDALTRDVFAAIYYDHVRDISPQAGGMDDPLAPRVPLRAIVSGVLPDVAFSECARDLAAIQREPNTVLSLLGVWMGHAQRQQLAGGELLKRAIGQLSNPQFVAPQMWTEIALALLTDDRIARGFQNAPDNEDRLIRAGMPGLTLRRRNPIQKTVAARYGRSTHPAITREQSIIMRGVLAMESGQLDGDLAKTLRGLIGKYGNASPEIYGAEIKLFMERFFQSDISEETHRLMIEALYNWGQEATFWEQYWANFRLLLLDPGRAKQSTELLRFWFETSPKELVQTPFVYQTFFMELPEFFESIRSEKNFKVAAQSMTKLAGGRDWFRLVQAYMQTERRGFLGLFKR